MNDQTSLVNAKIAVPVNPAVAADVSPDGTVCPPRRTPRLGLASEVTRLERRVQEQSGRGTPPA